MALISLWNLHTYRPPYISGEQEKRVGVKRAMASYIWLLSERHDEPGEQEQSKQVLLICEVPST